MVGKAAGFAFCAHCGAHAAEVECAGCGQMTCRPCATDFRTCRVPHVVSRQLPRRHVVRRIDSGCERALMGRTPSLLQRIFGIARRQRLIDLATLEPATVPVAPPWDAIAVRAGGEAVWVREARSPDYQRTLRRVRGGWGAMRSTHIRYLYDRISGDERTLWSIIDNVLWYCDIASGEETAGGGLPRRLLVTAAAVDRAGEPVLLGSIGRVDLWVPAGDRFRRAGAAELPGEAEVARCVMRGGRAAVVSQRFADRGLRRRLHAYQIAGDALAPIELPDAGVDLLRAPIDLSADGRWLAIAGAGGALVVHDLERGAVTVYDDHDAAITALRVAADGSRIVSADAGGRLVLRPLVAVTGTSDS